MHIKSSVIEKSRRKRQPDPVKEMANAAMKDKLEILEAIHNITIPEAKEPVVLKPEMPPEVIEQQKEILEKVSEKKTPPAYHFTVNRDSQGYIKSVDATPKLEEKKEERDVAGAWYNTH